MCKECSQYFPSYAALNRHKISHKQRLEVEDAAASESDEEENVAQVQTAELAPIFENILEALQSPFVEVE